MNRPLLIDSVRRQTSDVRRQPAADTAVVAAARAHSGELTVVSLEPLTNIALAVRAAPDIMAHINRVVVMGGTGQGPGNVTPWRSSLSGPTPRQPRPLPCSPGSDRRRPPRCAWRTGGDPSRLGSIACGRRVGGRIAGRATRPGRSTKTSCGWPTTAPKPSSEPPEYARRLTRTSRPTEGQIHLERIDAEPIDEG